MQGRSPRAPQTLLHPLHRVAGVWALRTIRACARGDETAWRESVRRRDAALQEALAAGVDPDVLASGTPGVSHLEVQALVAACAREAPHTIQV